MANEATITSTLQINKDNLSYKSQPTSFKADVSTAKGATPGNIVATVTGVDADLSALTTPGLCRLMNLDGTNYVTYGIWDGVSFYPLGELLPGESYVLRLARDLSQEFGTGTGTTGASINTLRLKASTASCNVLVEAFEK